MTKQVRLIHSLHQSKLQEALQSGLRAGSDYDDLGLDIRQNTVYCWLRKEDDKLSSNGQKPEHVYLEITVDEDRCTVAEMDFASLALMYRQGQRGKPKDERVAALFGDIYRLTSVPLCDYKPGVFWSPEVLVKGEVEPECIRVIRDGGSQ